MSATRADVAGRRSRNPSLVLRFTLFTAVGLAVTSVAIFLVVRGFVTAHAEDAVERNTRFVAAAVLSRQLRPSDFEAPVSESRVRELDRLFERQVLEGMQRIVVNEDADGPLRRQQVCQLIDDARQGMVGRAGIG